MENPQRRVGASARTWGGIAFAGEAAVATSRAGGEARVFATDLALAPWGWVQRQRAVRPNELHPSLAHADFKLFPARFPRRLAHSPAMARALRTEVPNCDVVHIHNLWQHPQYAAFRAAREAQIPYIVSPHGSSIRIYGCADGSARRWRVPSGTKRCSRAPP